MAFDFDGREILIVSHCGPIRHRPERKSMAGNWKEWLASVAKKAV